MAGDEDDDVLAGLIRRHATRHTPPEALAARIAEQVRAAGTAAHPPRAAPTWPRWLRAVGWAAAGAAAAWALALVLLVPPPQDPVVQEVRQEVVAGHVRSLMGAHLADIASSDRHTVKPWFAGKLDYSPPVVDLADRGWPLIGGRLDYLQGRPVAALVYGSGRHVINVFAWPDKQKAATDMPPALQSRQGYQLVHWVQSGMQAWAVSDLNGAELQAFAALLQERAAAVRP